MSQEKIENFYEKLAPEIVKKLKRIFPDFDENELAEDDRELWRLIQSGLAKKADYEEYRRKLLGELRKGTAATASSRFQFCDFLGDRMQELILKNSKEIN